MALLQGYNNTGCYDLLCPGFVQTDPIFPLGSILPVISVYKGSQTDITVKIYQDTETLNWWLLVSTREIPLGYWPRELFTHLDECATDLSFGGTVKNIPGLSYPLMGYGFFPLYDIFRSAYFKNIKYIGSDRLAVTPLKEQTFKSENSPECYRVLNIGLTTLTGYTITYGGHGGQNC
ncbi:hypothetical protein MLD38_040791 [Melastoma candidum]|nr:hypothetical protein MLD38_040791 [Melastoma candidum]